MIKIATVSLSVVLFGQLGFTAATYYLGIQNPSVPFWATLYGALAIVITLRGITLKISTLDFLFFACFGLMLVSFLLAGESNNLTFEYYFALFVVGPYLCGRLLADRFSRSVSKFVYGLAILLFLLMTLEFVRDPSLFARDRLLIFAPEDARYIAGGTAYYVGALFGSAFVISLTSLTIDGRQKGKDRFVAIVMMLLSLSILVLWGSRGSGLAALAVAAILLVHNVSWTRLVVYGVALSALVVVVYLNLSPTRQAFIDQVPAGLETIWQSSVCITEGDSVLAHLTVYNEAFRLFAQSPIFGIGASNFGLYYCGPPADLASPHSSLLHILVEFGLVGAIIWSIALVSIVWTFLRAEMRADRQRRVILWYVFVLWLFTFFVLQTAGNLYYDYHFYMLTGLLVAGLVERQRGVVSYRPQPRLLPKATTIPTAG